MQRSLPVVLSSCCQTPQAERQALLPWGGMREGGKGAGSAASADVLAMAPTRWRRLTCILLLLNQSAEPRSLQAKDTHKMTLGPKENVAS